MGQNITTGKAGRSVTATARGRAAGKQADGKVTPIERAGIKDQARRVAAKATGVARG